MTDDTTAQPITVSKHGFASAGGQFIRYSIVLGCGVLINHFLESEVLTGVAVAMLTAAVTYGWGLVTWFNQRTKLKALAHMLPDDKAVVK